MSKLDEAIHTLSLDGGTDEEIGDANEQGLWAGIMRGGPSIADALADDEYALPQAELDEVRDTAGVILTVNSQGFREVNYYDDAKKLESDWKEYERELGGEMAENARRSDDYAIRQRSNGRFYLYSFDGWSGNWSGNTLESAQGYASENDAFKAAHRHAVRVDTGDAVVFRENKDGSVTQIGNVGTAHRGDGSYNASARGALPPGMPPGWRPESANSFRWSPDADHEYEISKVGGGWRIDYFAPGARLGEKLPRAKGNSPHAFHAAEEAAEHYRSVKGLKANARGGALDAAKRELAERQLAEYGYSLDEKNQIQKSGKTFSLPATVSAKGPRFYVKQPSGATLWSGGDLGDFVKSFWYAKKVGHQANARGGEVDETAADELHLYIDNESDLSPMGPSGQGKAIRMNLEKKIANGTFNYELSIKGWEYLAEAGAKRYAKEFASPGEWSKMFSPATRRRVAEFFAKDFADEHQMRQNGRIEQDQFLRSYLAAALWSSTDESDDSGGNPLDDNYSADDFSEEALEQAKKDCAAFQEENAADLSDISLDAAGIDFWLTRNRHGAGFWDRGLGKLGERLTKSAHAYGEVHLYVGNDGMIHSS